MRHKACGSNGHLNGEMFKMRAGIDLLHVPYKGSAPAVTDLVGGQVQLMFDNLPSVLERIPRRQPARHRGDVGDAQPAFAQCADNW